jgi:hypothetical protein
MATTDIRIKLTPIQARVLRASAPFIDLEGGIRSGKSTAANIKKHQLVVEHPGIHLLHARWTDEDTHGEMLPKWREFAQSVGLDLRWHPDEQYDEVLGTTGPSGHNSRVYVRGLRSGESASPYKAIRGLDLAWFHIEQAEELPAGYWGELLGRLSQVGYPHGGLLTPQPVNVDHWIAKKVFKEHNPDPKYLYVRTNCYDNRENVGDDYIAELEAAYPVGSSERRTLLEGRRGLAIPGDPVYGGYFRRSLHVSSTLEMSRATPLLEGWDFGHSHPCVSWWQWLPIGRLQLLGAVMGEDVYLEDFVPIALRYRGEWCPDPLEVWSVGDPAGLDITNQGTQTSKVRDILAAHGVTPISQSHANRPEVRYGATQVIAGQMRRLALDGEPAFLARDRSVIVRARGAEPNPFAVDGFEAGYVWDTRQVVGLAANIRRPKKDGFYDHCQNTAEYIVLAFGGEAQPTQADVAKMARRELRRAQVDDDPDDPPRGGRRRVSVGIGGRGGY